MEHLLVMGTPVLFGAGVWLRWSATATVTAFWLGRRVERLQRSKV